MKPFVSISKTNKGEQLPPLPMRLLCLGVWSKTLSFWEFLKVCKSGLGLFMHDFARTTFHHSNLGTFSVVIYHLF